MAPPCLTREICRRLFLAAQLPAASGTGAPALRQLIQRLGFVQVDSINVIERAHHLTLRSRMEKYRPALLTRLLDQRLLFEHWTHDAALIPVEYLRYWRYRAGLYQERVHQRSWWQERLGADPETLVRHIREQVAERGPVTSRAFESGTRSGAWWGWKPEKVALEYLWRAGELSISSRQGFQKVYDLTERVFPQLALEPPVSAEEYQDWAFRQALERLGAATPKELAEFWGELSTQEALQWCARATGAGSAVAVELEGAGPGVSVPDWETRLAGLRLPAAPRLLNPFDPIVRDRKRLLRLFGFDYRFEAYVPAPKRVHGYFVLPIIERDRFIARLDAKFHRQRGELEVKGVWWEPSARPTPKRKETLEQAIRRLETWLGS